MLVKCAIEDERFRAEFAGVIGKCKNETQLTKAVDSTSSWYVSTAVEVWLVFSTWMER